MKQRQAEGLPLFLCHLWYTFAMKIFGAVHDWLESVGANTALIYAPFLILGFAYLVTRIPFDYVSSLSFLLFILPIFAPFVLFTWFYKTWMKFIYMDFGIKQGGTTLEVRIPKDVFKSPEAMEQVFMQLYQPASPDNIVQALWDGKSPPSFSFEIASREGAIHFYINTPKKKFKNLIETHLYAQYPGVEIRELDIDYTAEIPLSLEGYVLFGFHFGRNKRVGPPIRTYIDWGLNDFPEEEEKIDPMSSMLEAFAAIGAGEHLWLQFIITPNRKTSFQTGTLTAQPDAKDDIKKAIKDFLGVKTSKKDEKGEPIIEAKKASDLSDYEKTQLATMQRQLNRYLFNTTIRGVYVARGEKFNGERISLLAAIMRSFDVPGFGTINPGRFKTDVNWPWWQNIGGKNVQEMKLQTLKSYKQRGGTEYDDEDTVFSTEELATLWHIPGRTVTAPTLGRIESTRREAPSNLPI